MVIRVVACRYAGHRLFPVWLILGQPVILSQLSPKNRVLFVCLRVVVLWLTLTAHPWRFRSLTRELARYQPFLAW